MMFTFLKILSNLAKKRTLFTCVKHIQGLFMEAPKGQIAQDKPQPNELFGF